MANDVLRRYVLGKNQKIKPNRRKKIVNKEEKHVDEGEFDVKMDSFLVEADKWWLGLESEERVEIYLKLNQEVE